jgi:hypothetical protein
LWLFAAEYEHLHAPAQQLTDNGNGSAEAASPIAGLRHGERRCVPHFAPVDSRLAVNEVNITG